MAMIDLQNIHKQYGTKIILKEANFSLLEGQRVALLGQNGQGKSTLMKIITGEVEIDSGIKSIDKKLRIEMLAQQPKFAANLSVRDAIEEQLVEIKQTRDEYEKITELLNEDYENMSLIERQSELASYLDYHDAWDIDTMIEKVLVEFQLKPYENKDVNILSGGEQRRVSLAGLLLKKPDVLLLDEPTNHLDVYMVEFLEQLIIKAKFTLLFISHDRYFIDNIATSVIEIDDGVLRKFQGGYTSYLEEKQQLLSNMQKDHHNMIRLFKREAHWMQRGVTARRKRNVLRKDNYLELKKKVKSNPSYIRKMTIDLQREQKSFNSEDIRTVNRKKMLFELDDIGISLGKKLLIKDFTTRILQKDTIAIVGPNGTGKSTLLKIFMEKLLVDEGKFKKGDFKVGYFDQHRDMLSDDQTIMDLFCPFGGDRVELSDGRSQHVYGYLKNFLFPREYLEKKIGLLSGGEKNRVALAWLFTQKIDCLVLDEPTNDLDIPTINILEEYLDSFQGAVIFVSHDRYFVDKLAKKLFVFKGYNGEIMESLQPYSEYLEIEKELKDLAIMEKELVIEEKIVVQKKQNTQKKFSYNEQRAYDNLPKEIESLEKEIELLNKCLLDASCYEEKGLIAVSNELQETEEIYEKKVEQFLELEELYECFNA
ncbi:MAG: ABC-F family ATP-binding cassette domain-containing protein [Campylobacteraceae bacterium]|nr:ABC-F family ATP-binding cassette domain-containing protein [Campylobacteraceae bacterium]